MIIQGLVCISKDQILQHDGKIENRVWFATEDEVKKKKDNEERHSSIYALLDDFEFSKLRVGTIYNIELNIGLSTNE